MPKRGAFMNNAQAVREDCRDSLVPLSSIETLPAESFKSRQHNIQKRMNQWQEKLQRPLFWCSFLLHRPWFGSINVNLSSMSNLLGLIHSEQISVSVVSSTTHSYVNCCVVFNVPIYANKNEQSECVNTLLGCIHEIWAQCLCKL